MGARLLDERSEPSVRQVLGGLLAGATSADFAIGNIRLEGLDLSVGELGGVQRCRVLLGRLNAATLADASSAPEAAAAALRRLAAFLASGRVQVRAAGAGAWSPDFSILRTPLGATVLLGAHYFGRPEPAGGAVFTCALSDAEVEAALGLRFEELWERGYDVLEVVQAAIRVGLGEPAV